MSAFMYQKRVQTMKHSKIQHLIFMALCCDLGMISKQLISPISNIVTDFLHIPGGISTSFSLMFLVVAATLTPKFGSGVLMGTAQSMIALAMGRTGSMGVLSPIGYIVPGLVIDCVMYLARKIKIGDKMSALIANMLASAAASLTANLIVFRLNGVVLLLYLSVACTSGAICGVLGGSLIGRLKSIIQTPI